MKTLFVLRHAKAEEATAGQLDFDRDLSKRGKQDAEAVGRKLLEEKLVPQAIIASAARRTRKTAKRVAEGMSFSTEILETRDLYDAGLHQIIEVIHSLPDSAESALIVGHNPGIGDFVSRFGQPQSSYPTATISQLKLPLASWSDLTFQTSGELLWQWRPQGNE